MVDLRAHHRSKVLCDFCNQFFSKTDKSNNLKKARTELFIRKFIKIYTLAAAIATTLIAFVPPLFFSGAWGDWIMRAAAFLIVSSPFILLVSLPLTYSTSIRRAAELGIFFKSSASLDAMSRLKTVIFDKTGTLTTGNFQVISVESEEISSASLLMLAAHTVSCLAGSQLANAITSAYGDDINTAVLSDIQIFDELSVSVKVRDVPVCCGNLPFMEYLNIETGDYSEDDHVVYVAVNGKYAGRILLSDALKEDAPAAIFRLQSLGCDRVIMLSGDKEYSARKIANALGISEYKAECVPENRAEYLEKVLANKKRSETAAYIGCGTIDNSIYASPDILIALGSSITEVADVVIMKNTPAKIADAVFIARKSDSIVKMNISFSLLSKLIIVILCVCGIFSLPLAIAIDIAVSVLILVNAARIRTFSLN